MLVGKSPYWNLPGIDPGLWREMSRREEVDLICIRHYYVNFNVSIYVKVKSGTLRLAI